MLQQKYSFIHKIRKTKVYNCILNKTCKRKNTQHNTIQYDDYNSRTIRLTAWRSLWIKNEKYTKEAKKKNQKSNITGKIIQIKTFPFFTF